MIAKVIVDISNSEVDKIFDYLLPSSFCVEVGDRVIVPFGNRTIEGFCINITCETEESKDYNLKTIIKKLDKEPLISKEMIELMQFMKDKFYIRFVDSLRLFIPTDLRGGKIKEQVKEFITLNPDFSIEEIKSKISKRAKAQISVVEKLEHGGEYQHVLNNEFANTAVKALLENGLVIKNQHVVFRVPYKQLQGDCNKVILTSDQKRVVEECLRGEKQTILLHGVTGSGKTEVYMECITEVLKQGKTAIMLVPEISLTPQILKLFRSRFGDQVAMIHSGLSSGERYDEWRRLFKGEARIAIGARSAVFAPLENLGIIIVDEEHDQSYISENNPRFNTISVAQFRAEYNNIHLILGSATPSIESYLNAKNDIYGLSKLERRISENGLPQIEVIDMAKEIRNGNFNLFSQKLKDELIYTVKNNNQAMIFLNRRGYASFMMCKECGYIAKCSDCDISLTYHHEDNMLKCHYCGKRFKALTQCAICGSKSIRQGKIGTEKVVEEIKKFLPNVNILRMDNDTTNTKTAYLEILGAFSAGEAQIMVGTQMIAKGHDFPNVTLVGVLDADMSLYFSDYRSAERTFQIITQVSGRAGRAEKVGRVYIQTFSPNHYIFKYVKNYDYVNFFEKECNTREVTKFPPFTSIIRILISSEKEESAVDNAKNIYCHVKEVKALYSDDFVYIQAMKAPITRIQNKFRYQIIMRIKRGNELLITSKIYGILEKTKMRGVSTFVEINPQNMS